MEKIYVIITWRSNNVRSSISICIIFYLFNRDNQENDVFIFLLLILLGLIDKYGFNEVLLKPLENRYSNFLEPNHMQEFSKFSLPIFDSIENQNYPLFLHQSIKQSQIPVPFLEDPFISIDFNFIFENPINCEFELFKFLIISEKEKLSS